MPAAEPTAKRRRISDENDDDEIQVVKAAAKVLKQSKPPKTVFPPARKPFDLLSTNSGSRDSLQPILGVEGYFTVLWRKFTTKKNKTWDGDGVLSVSGGYAKLQDISGKEFGRTVCKMPLLIGSELTIGGKDVEVESMISKGDFMSGRVFLGQAKQLPPTLQQLEHSVRPSSKAQVKHGKIAKNQVDQVNKTAPTSTASQGAFKNPQLNNTVQVQTNTKLPVPRHNPNTEGALVMKRPRSVPNGKQIVDVVVDPILTKHLREHQRAGVCFMYECVMGMKQYEGEGAVLADEMGLGKTLQTIALLWTLLKQNPIYQAEPVIKKALIVCPVTLINNWRKEIRKWLGTERVGVFVAESKKTRLTDFTMGKSYNIMIIGYEKLRLVQDDLRKGSGIDIVIADEGHRLKTAQNKSALAIKSLNTERRVVLSGTPIQNDLAEFFTMVDFVNPGLLNKYSTFKREFENPILKSRQPGVSPKDQEKGEARSEELKAITNKFILRRTSEILLKYLPSKTEYVVFCRPTEVQTSVYHAITNSSTFNAALGTSAMSLELINILKKVCNSPNLLGSAKSELLAGVPQAFLKSPGASGKLQVLDSLLHIIRSTTKEKVVLVSNYTSTMDILANLLSSLSYTYLRLDGTTPPAKRQDLVDRFNRSPPSNSFVFLLSAKAGGTGLNLIGASRLILFDLDWNPATDLQAMARVHRDGQKRPCYIYRLLTQGALDEKIFQRQISKTGLADSIVDGKGAISGFSREELRDLFTLDESEECQTHKLLSCSCDGRGTILSDPAEELIAPRNDLADLSALNRWSNEVYELPESQSRKDLPLHKSVSPSKQLRGRGRWTSPGCTGSNSPSRAICSKGSLLDQGGPSRGFLDGDWICSQEACGYHNFAENVSCKSCSGRHTTSKMTTAKDYDWQTTEAEIERKAKECKDSSGKTKMLSLMQYVHFDTRHIGRTDEDCASPEQEDINAADVDGGGDEEEDAAPKVDLLDLAIEDAALRTVLREDGKRIGFVFTKMSS